MRAMALCSGWSGARRENRRLASSWRSRAAPLGPSRGDSKRGAPRYRFIFPSRNCRDRSRRICRSRSRRYGRRTPGADPCACARLAAARGSRTPRFHPLFCIAIFCAQLAEVLLHVAADLQLAVTRQSARGFLEGALRLGSSTLHLVTVDAHLVLLKTDSGGRPARHRHRGTIHAPGTRDGP